MNRLISHIVAILLMCIATCQAAAQTTFTISSKVALPVHVKVNGGGSLSISQREYTTSQSIPNATITDAYGNRCMVRQSHHYRSGQGTHYYYQITGTYSSSSSSYDSGGSRYDDSSGSYGLRSTGEKLAETVGRGVLIPCEGHPYFSLGAGMSRSVGEFVRAKFVTGGVAGFVISGSVGKDWIFDTDYNDKLSWNAGLGVRFGDPNNDVSLNALVGRTPWHPKVGLIANLEYEHFFGDAKRFGVFGNIGFAVTGLDEKKEKEYFDFMVGCAVKLWQK